MNNENQKTVGATCEKSSVVGNAAEMREELEKLKDRVEQLKKAIALLALKNMQRMKRIKNLQAKYHLNEMETKNKEKN